MRGGPTNETGVGKYKVGSHLEQAYMRQGLRRDRGGWVEGVSAALERGGCAQGTAHGTGEACRRSCVNRGRPREAGPRVGAHDTISELRSGTKP